VPSLRKRRINLRFENITRERRLPCEGAKEVHSPMRIEFE